MEKQYSEPTLEVIAVGCGDVVTVSYASDSSSADTDYNPSGNHSSQLPTA